MSYPAESPGAGVFSSPPPGGEWVVAGRPSGVELRRRFLGWPRLLWKRRDLVAASVRRDLEARFRGTLLGFAWVLALPLLQFAIYAFVFTQLLGVRLGASAPAGAMGVYMFTGTLVWSALADALSRSTTCLVDHRHLLQKLPYPAQLLPVQIGLSSLVTLLAGIAAFAAFCAASGVWSAPGRQLLVWAPLLLLLQLALTTGLGLLFAALHLRLRDTQPFVGVALTVGMFVTPIFWVPSEEVLPGVGEWRWLVELNPAHHLVYAWRELLMSGGPELVFDGSFARSLGIVGAAATVTLCAGSWAFFRVERHLADEL